MMYLVSGNNYCILAKNKNITTIKLGKYYCAQMGKIRPFTNEDTVIGLSGEELLKWCWKNKYRHIKNDSELVRLMLLLN